MAKDIFHEVVKKAIERYEIKILIFDAEQQIITSWIE